MIINFRFVAVLAALLFFLGAGSTVRAQRVDRETMSRRELEARAELLVRDLFAGRVLQAQSQMTVSLRRTMTEKAIRQIFGDLMMTSGKLKKISPASAFLRSDGAVVAQVPIETAGDELIVYVVFERLGPLARVISLDIKPESEVPVELRPAKPVHDPGPSYANAALFKEVPYRIQIEDRSLDAVFSVPTVASESAQVPAVLLMNPGFGYDADSSMMLSASDFPTSPSYDLISTRMGRDLAQGLASRGVAVLRFADRLYDEPDYINSAYGLNDLILRDAIAAAKALAQQPQVNVERITIVGAGLGGYIAPVVAEASRSARVAILQPWPLDLESGFQNHDAATSAGLWTSDFAPHLQSERFWFDLERAAPGESLKVWTKPAVLLGSGPLPGDWKEIVAKGGLMTSWREYPGLTAQFIAQPVEGSHFAYVDERVVRDLAIFAKTGRLP